VRRVVAGLTALLIAKPPPKYGSSRDHYYHYDVVFDGEVVVANHWEAVCEFARALLARGITGEVTLLDGTTHKPRLIVDIEKAAKLTVRETRREGPRFVKWKPFNREVYADGTS
jgi:hypothetical protein